MTADRLYRTLFSLMGLVTLAVLLVGCLPGPGFFEQNQSAIDAVAEVKTVDDGEKTVGIVSASSPVTQRIRTSETSDLAGVELSIPSGTLQFDMSISMDESASLTSGKAAAQMGVSFGSEAGKAVNLRNDRGVLEIPAHVAPMTLQIPIAAGGLLLTNNLNDVLVTFMRQELGQGDCLEQIFPPDSFQLVDNKIQIGVRRFGAYQPIYMPATDLAKLKDGAKNGVISIFRAGCRIETKVEQKSLPPVSITFVSAQATERILSLQARVAGEDIDSCYLVGNDSLSGKDYQQTASQPHFKIDFREYVHALDARFLIGCDLLSGRNVETSFHRVELAAVVLSLQHSYDDRRLVVTTNIPKSQVNSCRYIIKSRIGRDQEGNVADPVRLVIDLSTTGEIDADLHIQCQLRDGKTVATAKKSFYLPPFAKTSEPILEPTQPTDPIREPTDPILEPTQPTDPILEPTQPTDPIVEQIDPNAGEYQPLNLMEIFFSSPNVVAGNTLELKVKAGSSYAVTKICFSAENSSLLHPYFGCHTMGPIVNGYYTGNIYIPTYLHNETHKVINFTIYDQWNHQHFYYRSNNEPYLFDTSILIPEFTVSGATPDETPPNISQLIFTQASAMPGQFIYLNIIADDPESGIEERFDVCIDLKNRAENHAFLDCRKLEYIISENQYQAEIYVPMGIPNGDYYVKHIYLRNQAGYYTDLYLDYYSNNYPDTTIAVPQIQISILGEGNISGNPQTHSVTVKDSLGNVMYAPYQVAVGDTVTLEVDASDPAGRPLEYKFHHMRSCAGVFDIQDWSGLNHASYTFVAADATSCTQIVIGVRNDDEVYYDSELLGDHQFSVQFSVDDGTVPPVVDSVVVRDSGGNILTEPYIVNANENVTIEVSASDPNSLPLEYLFYKFTHCGGVGEVQGWSSSSSTTFQFGSADTSSCTMIVVGVRNNDGNDHDSEMFGDLQHMIQFKVSNGTTPPVIDSVIVRDSLGNPLSQPYQVQVGDQISFEVFASDPNDLPLEYKFHHMRNCDGVFDIQDWSTSNVATYTFVSADITKCNLTVLGVRNNDGTDYDSEFLGDLQYSVQFEVAP